MSIVKNLFLRTVKEISTIEPGETIIVRDFFPSCEWDGIELGYRRSLGLVFWNYVQKEGANFLSPIGKTPLKQQRYQKL